jgi:hypothetical protein
MAAAVVAAAQSGTTAVVLAVYLAVAAVAQALFPAAMLVWLAAVPHKAESSLFIRLLMTLPEK